MSIDNARRGFLRKSITIVPVAALGSAACTQQGSTTTAPQSSVSQPAARYKPVYFNATEWTFIEAAVGRLIPADDIGPGGVESGVPEFIDRQMDAAFGHGANWYMQGPFVESAPEFGYQAQMPPRDVYRAGIAAADAYCKSAFSGKTFSQLATADQDRVLKRFESGEAVFDSVSSRTFFTFLLQNTKEGYLSDPLHGGNKDAGSWKMIGFPGARADFADWVGKPVQYPLPPVTINGPQG